MWTARASFGTPPKANNPSATWHADRTYVLEKVCTANFRRSFARSGTFSAVYMDVFNREIVWGALWRAAGSTKDERHSLIDERYLQMNLVQQDLEKVHVS